MSVAILSVLACSNVRVNFSADHTTELGLQSSSLLLSLNMLLWPVGKTVRAKRISLKHLGSVIFVSMVRCGVILWHLVSNQTPLSSFLLDLSATGCHA